MQKSWWTMKGNSARVSSKRAVGSVFFLGIVMAGLLLLSPVFFSSLSRLFWYPAEQFRVWLTESQSALPTVWRDRQELLDEIRRLEIKIATEQGTDSTVRRLQVENDQFRALLGAETTARVVARVVARPPQLPYDLIMLDRGSVDGVQLNAPVFAGLDTVFGVVSQVNQNTSYVTPLSHPSLTFTVFIVGPNIFTVAEGLGGGVVRVRVPQGIAISKNDIVLLPAADAAIVGKIEEVRTTPTKPERHGYITFPQPLQSLPFVSVSSEPLVTPDFDVTKEEVFERVKEILTLAVPPDILVRPATISENEEGEENGTEAGAEEAALPLSETLDESD